MKADYAIVSISSLQEQSTLMHVLEDICQAGLLHATQLICEDAMPFSMASSFTCLLSMSSRGAEARRLRHADVAG